MGHPATDDDAARARRHGDARVGVVIITRNRSDELARTLERLEALPERPEVVVVDNGSTDGTGALVRERHPRVRLVSPGRNLGAAGRNLGVHTLDAPYVAFCDDDTWPEPGALRRAADTLDRHSDVAVVTGHIVVEPSGRDDPICEELRDSPLPTPSHLPGPALLSFLAAASVVRRSSFEDVGGFEPRLFLGGEEELLGCDLAAAGWWLVHLPEVVVHHAPSSVRDAHLRRRHGIRNTLWFTWLRRPLPSAFRRTVRMARTVPWDRTTVAGVLDAAAGTPWVVRHRRVVPREVEAGLALLDEPQLASRARRYVS